jgi:hypothetical protein
MRRARLAPRPTLVLLAAALSAGACSDATDPFGGGAEADLGAGGRGAGNGGSEPDAFSVPVQDAEVRGGDARTYGTFGEPCELGEECESGFCVENPGGGRICTVRCADDCPAGFECNPIANTGADRTFVCLADQPDLCKPCSAHSDCDDEPDLCVGIGNGKYCGEDCSDDGFCPEGYECRDFDVPSDGGEVLKARQCAPVDGRCLPCRDEDGDGYGDGGDCLGIDCDDNDPATYQGAPERCDGRDNDCNSLPDDPATLEAVPEGVTCFSAGVCRGATPVCASGSWTCNYPESYEDVVEVSCDGIDNNCDGTTDEGVRNACGVCGPPAVELCNGLDDDCNGQTDETFDLLSDLSHCGRCGNLCVVTNAQARCAGGNCAIAECDDGWNDANGNAGDGCEYACRFSNDGVEACDGRDNDCDTQIDEGIDVTQDVLNCGRCGNGCAFDQGVAACIESTCELAGCDPGFYDIDGDALNGCEYACERLGDADDPDPAFVDANCDGIDGEIGRAVFVSPRGNDLGAGTMNDPVGTLDRAMDLAQAQGKYVLAGEGVFEGTLALRSGQRLYGGYRADDGWRRGADFETRVRATGLGAVAETLNAPSLLDLFTLEAVTDPNPGASTYGLVVRDSGDFLTVRGGRIIAGNGSGGLPGGAGVQGLAGNPGARGSDGCDAGLFGTGGCTAQGGQGGPATVCPAGDAGGAGVGGQAANGAADGSPGAAGGASEDGIQGGNGGNGGRRGSHQLGCGFLGLGCCDPQKGETAGPGGAGLAGVGGDPGTAGSDFGGLSRDGLYTLSLGGAGTIGRAGGGGGGGGGGGCGGNPGGGGGGGGGAFGVWVIRSAPRLAPFEVRTGDGGSGGIGGAGGPGGEGGRPGGGGVGNQTAGDGGTGGLGGVGGTGGPGGGGGGGPSIGVVFDEASAPVLEVVSFTLGQGGAGGPGGGPGAPAGSPGVRAATRP